VKRVRPYPFDRVARLLRAQVEAGRALLAHLPLEAGEAWLEAAASLGGPVQLSLDETYAFPVKELGARLGLASGPRAADAPALLRLAAPMDRYALLAIDPALAPRLARRALGVEASELVAARPLTPAEQGALGFLVAALVDGTALRVDGFVAPGARDLAWLFPDPWVLALDARVRSPVGNGWARLLVPERLRVRTPLPRTAATLLARRDRLARAPVSLRMEVGRTRLDRADFAGVQVRDVVLFENFGPRPPFGGPMALRLGRGGFAANLGGDGLTILEPFRLGDWTMDKHDESAPPAATDEGDADRAATDGLLRELPVEVVCELGRVTLTGRELLELRPGAVIPVGRPLAGPVDLTVGGRVVARGELVDVEGEIGVRVSQVND
jgi:type III secretion system YscQ/HrcQ family protein